MRRFRSPSSQGVEQRIEQGMDQGMDEYGLAKYGLATRVKSMPGGMARRE
jgi:hypothetical protein